MIYFVKIVDRFCQNPLNFTFTKYGFVFMENSFSKCLLRLKGFLNFNKIYDIRIIVFIENSNKKFFFIKTNKNFPKVFAT